MALTARATGGRGRPATVGLREKILDSASLIFARRDFHEVLMDDVARDCGVAKGTLYRYFPSKRALYLGVMFEGMDRLHETLREAVSGPGEPVAKLARLVYALLDHFWDRRLFITLIHRIEHRQGEPGGREWQRRRAQIARLIQTTFEEAVAAGEMRPLDPRIGAEMLLGMLRGVNRYRVAQDTLIGLVGSVLEVFVRGVGTEKGQRTLADVHLPPRRAGQPAADGIPT